MTIRRMTPARHRWRLWLAVSLLVLPLTVFVVLLHWQPSLDRWEPFRILEAPPAPLQVTWLGTATVLVTDGENAIMTDGFFSRQSLLSVASGPVEPDLERIGEGLETAGVQQLDAVVVLHSHYDHAMDAPEVARRTGALLVGSESTANVGRGWRLPESSIHVPDVGEVLRFGHFELELVPSAHVPMLPMVARLTGHGKTIDEPLVPPASISAWKEGQSYALMLRHPQGNLLIQGSAGFVGGELQGQSADIALLSTGSLGRQSDDYQRRYFEEMVLTTGAHTVIPMHWDDFFTVLDHDTHPLGPLLDNFHGAMEGLKRHSREHDRAFHMLRPLDRFSVEEGRLQETPP
ncbi:MBL fold metallo-hydrolase [Isoalcanivorax indicus]|uniref:MBL fold metallo-hydrolase n=1 Tax=Isoalcanivorax indicus TaxID=2202653 RepID=UPI000DB923D8|nr:MBL fold metallo-hydrolase [Isoalcanivorax indicus]